MSETLAGIVPRAEAMDDIGWVLAAAVLGFALFGLLGFAIFTAVALVLTGIVTI